MLYSPTGWSDSLKRFEFLKLSYEGGSAYKSGNDASGNDVLIKFKRETDADWGSSTYSTRKRLSVYRPYFKSIVDKISSYVLGENVQRDPNLTGGAFIPEQMALCVQYGLPMGQYWVGVDAPQVDITKIFSKFHQEVTDNTPYFILVNPVNVVDYEYTAGGELIRLAYKETYEIKPSMFANPEQRVIYREWLPDVVRLYECQSGTEPTQANLIEERSHSFGRVPFTTFNPDIAVPDMAEICRHLFNLYSLLDEEIVNCAFTSWLYTGMDQADTMNVNETTGEVTGSRDVGERTFTINPDAKVHQVAAHPEMAKNLMAYIDRDIDELYRLAGIRNTQKQMVESGEAKRLDFQDLEAVLRSVAQEAQEVENRLLPLIGQYQPSIWPTSFDVRSLADALDDMLKQMRIPYMPVSNKKRMVKAFIEKANPETDNERFINDVDRAVLIDKEGAEALRLVEDMLPDERVAEVLGINPNELQSPVEPEPMIAFEGVNDEAENADQELPQE